MDVIEQAQVLGTDVSDESPADSHQYQWFRQPCDEVVLKRFGFRFAPGGVHLSKTMMFRELTLLIAAATFGADDIQTLVLEANVLGKRTGTARRLALAHLNTLYGIQTPNPLAAVLAKLWHRRTDGRPLLALLCTLAREPLLRDSADAVVALPAGTPLHWPDAAAKLALRRPGRYSANMLNSLARNCASTWTQSGHLVGKVRKRRSVPIATPESAAYATLLGTLAGFGGPALLESPWMRTLDRTEPELLNLLRAAEGTGLLRLRAAGGVIEITIRRTMAENLGVPELGDS